jgi:hypothetical protein
MKATVYINNEYFYKRTLILDCEVQGNKIKWVGLDTYGEDYRFRFMKMRENSLGTYVISNYFGGRVYIESIDKCGE